MVDMSAIGAIAASLNAAVQLTKAAVDIRDFAQLRDAVIELQGIILATQQSALTAQAAQSSLLQRVRELEEEMARMKAWDAEKQRYALTEVSPSVFAYVLKRDAQGSEPTHCICAACYQHRKKAILQQENSLYALVLRCPECKNIITVKPLPIPIR